MLGEGLIIFKCDKPELPASSFKYPTSIFNLQPKILTKMNFEQDVKAAVEALKEGKVILYPTDTIWGLGCDPQNEEAVKKIYQIKGREEGKAMIILVERIEQLRDYVVQVPDLAWDIVEFAENPLTAIYPKGKNVSGNLLPPEGTIAIRVVKDEFCKAVIRKFGKAIVSTSANRSGERSPGNFSEIHPEIIAAADYVAEWRREDKTTANPSTIIEIGLKGEVKFIRK